MRVNPGFGHGHVQSCDTGGPSSKHGIWHEALGRAARPRERRQAADRRAARAHRHRPARSREFDENLRRLVELLAARIAEFPDVEAVNLGGGIPHPYRPGAPRYDLGGFRTLLVEAAATLATAAGRPDPRRDRARALSRSPGAGLLVCRVKDLKETETNAKGPGHRFIMVDAGFNDLVRPAMYGSYHHISIVGQGRGPRRPSRSSSPARCARAATSSRATSTSCSIRARCRGPTSAICSCCTTPAPTAPR